MNIIKLNEEARTNILRSMINCYGQFAYNYSSPSVKQACWESFMMLLKVYLMDDLFKLESKKERVMVLAMEEMAGLLSTPDRIAEENRLKRVIKETYDDLYNKYVDEES